MKRTMTTVRCVPRYGYEFTNVRLVEVDTPENAGPESLAAALERWFAEQGVADAVFAVDYDDDGPVAIINDEAYEHTWGEALF